MWGLCILFVSGGALDLMYLLWHCYLFVDLWVCVFVAVRVFWCGGFRLVWWLVIVAVV